MLVYSDHEKAAANGYDFDGWNASHQVYYYTGEGKVGDQVIYMRLWNLHYIAPRKRQDRSFGLWSVCRRSHRGAAGTGELLVSRTVRDLSAGSGLIFEDLGMRRLKGLPDDTNVFRVRVN